MDRFYDVGHSDVWGLFRWGNVILIDSITKHARMNTHKAKNYQYFYMILEEVGELCTPTCPVHYTPGRLPFLERPPLES